MINMKTTYLLIAAIILIGVAIFYFLIVIAPAERFGTGGRLGSASCDNNNHYMRSEKLNKMQKVRI